MKRLLLCLIKDPASPRVQCRHAAISECQKIKSSLNGKYCYSEYSRIWVLSNSPDYSRPPPPVYSVLENRPMTMSHLYTCGKPCSTGTHNETVKKLTLFSAFDRSNYDRTTALALFNGHSSERKFDKNHVKQTFHQRNVA